VTGQPRRYHTTLEDSTRWEGFEFRPGDIVISAPSKCGTTWVQMICALLVFQTLDLPAPLTTLSPWLDMRVRPLSEVRARLAAQRHRRFVKTHTPLDGLPADDRVTYLALGRDPRDVALSLRHQGANLRRDVLRGLLDEPDAFPGEGMGPAGPAEERTYFLRWMDNDDDPVENLDSLRGLVWQATQAWTRQGEPNVLLLHYGDLTRDREGEMRRLAGGLGIDVPERVWAELVAAAGFEQMRTRSAELVPDEGLGIMRSTDRFFRTGTSGGWRDVLSDDDRARYDARVSALAAPDLADWLHHGGRG